MVFSINQGSQMAKTQQDLVAERTEAKPDVLEEEMHLPGLPKIHLMEESELIQFFTMVLKSRPRIREINLTLGEGYEQTQKQVTVPKSNQLHVLAFEEVARVLVMALASGGKNCLGFKAVISSEGDGKISSKLYVRVANKAIHGPVFDENDNVAEEGDPEFDPKLIITCKP